MAYTDNFTTAETVALETHDANWVASLGAMTALSTDVCATDTGGHNGYYYNQTFASAHYSQTKASSGNYGGPCVRGAASGNYYYCYASLSANSYCGEVVSGSASDWDSGQASVSAGDVTRLEIDSSTTTTIYYKVNGSTVATFTSKSALSGGRAGVSGYGGGSPQFDDWEGGDVGVSAVSVTLDPATATATAIALANVNAPVTRVMDTASLIAIAIPFSVSAPESGLVVSLDTA